MPDKSLTTTQQSTVKRHSESITHGVVGNTLYDLLRNGGPTAVTYVMALLAFMQGWSWPLIILASVGVFLALTIVVAIIVTLRQNHRHELLQSELATENQRPTGVKSINGTGTVDNSPETINATLTAKFESEKAAMHAKHEAEIERLQENNTSLEHALDLRRQELEQYTWLHERAKEQSKDISRHVVVEQIRFCYHDFTAPIPFLIFGVDIHNKSVFDITIENTMEGHIGLAGEPLRGDKELWHNPKISPSGKESLTLKQRLMPEEVGLITRCENNELGAIYYFDKLVMRVAARTEFPQFERESLELPQHIGSKDSPLSNEIASLKAQLEEEKAKRAKPDITGKIKGVYCETWANAKLGDDGRVWFDHHFAVNTFVTNRGAATTIEQFNLVLKVGERSYDGERERDARDVKEGEINWRKWGADELGDLEKFNDEPLEYSRNGWLWFVVFRVENIENKAEMEIDLYAIDKDGISYKLDTSPQPQWQRNPFMYKEMAAAQRAQMREHF